jgi:hypothetical protein
MDEPNRLAWLTDMPYARRLPILNRLQPTERQELRYFWEL